MCHFIGKTDVVRMKYSDFAYDIDFARRDGFLCCSELQEWFGNPSYYADEEYDVITWKMLTKL